MRAEGHRCVGRRGTAPEPLEPRRLFAAGLALDLRLPGGGKLAEVDPGQVVSMELYAVVTGGDADAANDGFQFAWGSLLSAPVAAQPLLGGSLAATPAAPFDDGGSQAGAAQDLDGDGDLDAGSNATSADTSYLFARAGAMRVGAEFKVADVTFAVAAGAATGQQTNVNFRPAAFTGTFIKSALWQQDGAPRDNTTGPAVTPGAGVVLVVAPAPAVAEVFVSGSGWGDAFRGHLQTSGLGSSQFGYRVTAPDQLNELPWGNINQISVRFDRPVNIDVADVQVRGVTLADHAPTAVTYDAASDTATVTLPAAVLTDKVLLVLDGGAGGVSGQAGGRLLDGEWANAGLGPDAFPSGDGVAGGDFLFRFNVVRGDVSRDGQVNVFDTLGVKAKQGSHATNNPANYSALHDFNTDGQVNVFDTLGVKARQGTRLADVIGEPVAAAAPLFGQARVTTPQRLVDQLEDEAV